MTDDEAVDAIIEELEGGRCATCGKNRACHAGTGIAGFVEKRREDGSTEGTEEGSAA